MKKCFKCKQEKQIENFNFKFKAKGIRQAQCKSCTRSNIREHYYKNREYYLAKARKRNHKMRTLVREYMWSFLAVHPCVDCGENDPIVLEFDHIKEKTFTISSVGKSRPLEKVKGEIEKCEVRCANCHRRKTALQFGWNKSFTPL